MRTLHGWHAADAVARMVATRYPRVMETRRSHQRGITSSPSAHFGHVSFHVDTAKCRAIERWENDGGSIPLPACRRGLDKSSEVDVVHADP